MYYCKDTQETANTYESYLRTEHWNRIKKRFYILKKLFCRCCSRRHGIEVHHINYDNIGNESDEDLIPLCYECHEKLHNGYFAIEELLNKGKKHYKPLKIRMEEQNLKNFQRSKKLPKNLERCNKRNYDDFYLGKMTKRISYKSSEEYGLRRRGAGWNVCGHSGAT